MLLSLLLIATVEDDTIKYVVRHVEEIRGGYSEFRAYGLLQDKPGEDGKIKLILMYDGVVYGAAVLNKEAFEWASKNVPSGDYRKDKSKAVHMIVHGKCLGKKNTSYVFFDDAKIIKLLKD